ncbi:transcriptional regulator, MarR family [Legionella beliardensis]|uniref:Transcriptional regulator, MarR family n=1 Tax=Legionella beliardensis TaxID=91822 RepID=A0A378I4S1_9GAMM|nr:MarR family transcriptional regulator [Legionella beliardensis]STX29705.1 transcriptional regulator, MarR family [Legionella beliardensis]
MSKLSDPSHLENHLGYWLRCLSNFVSGSFAEKLATLHISVAQWVVLRTLFDYDSTTLNEAAHAIGVDKSSLSRMIERLVQRELVKRAEGKDRRSVSLSLTAAGRKLVPKLAKLADENDEAFFRSLSLREREKLLFLIKQLLKANNWDLTTHGKDRML